MKFGKTLSAVGVAAALLTAAAPAAFAKKPAGPNLFTTACGDGTVTVTPETLWPPNHKLATISISYVETATDTAADTISLTINSITDDELAQDPGTAGTPDSCGPDDVDWVFDSTPVTASDPSAAATTVQVRAERCGDDKAQGGRKYTINLTCAGSDGSTDTIDVPVVVPHDQSKKHKH